MGPRKDNRPWRKLVKKLRRKRIRQKFAEVDNTTKQVESKTSSNFQEVGDNSCDESNKSTDIIVLDTTYFMTEDEWNVRDKHRQLVSVMKLAEEERLKKSREEEENRIREQWIEKERLEKLQLEEKERMDKERLLKQRTIIITRLECLSNIDLDVDLSLQEEDYNQFLDFLCGDIETPPLPYVMPENYDDTGQEICKMFVKTGACRFFERCKLAHPTPVLSQTILVSNFFTHFLLQESLRDEYDVDLGLEYEKSELQKEFLEFYHDVLPEFQKHGKVIQFKVCCNLEAHLRGNVYIQFDNIRSAVEAFRTFNARFYNGRQISLRFVKLDSWRTAICWSFLNRHCVKGGSCNYLHVFRNPTKEFVQADRDFKDFGVSRPSSSTYLTDTPTTSQRTPRLLTATVPTSSSTPLNTSSTKSRHTDDVSRTRNKDANSPIIRQHSRPRPSNSKSDKKRSSSSPPRQHSGGSRDHHHSTKTNSPTTSSSCHSKNRKSRKLEKHKRSHKKHKKHKLKKSKKKAKPKEES